MNNKSCCIILLAAGKSTRFKNKVKKQFYKIKNKTLLEHNLDVFLPIKFVKQIVIVAAKEDLTYVDKIVKKYETDKIVIVKGGKERYESVYNAIQTIDTDKFKYIIIHDVARPLVSKKLINTCLNNIKNYDGVIPGIQTVDTVKIVNKKFEIEKTLNRDYVVLVQTPQVFKSDVAKHIYSKQVLNKWIKKYKITDDAQLAELEGFKIKVVSGERKNLKITTKEDLNLLDYFLKTSF
jgi:2-C-methyl-D-erythritol 4-phosphate cytidylyltransferase